MIFRVLDIETIPDPTVWTPGEAQWKVVPTSREHGNWDAQVAEVEPFPAPQAHRVVAVVMPGSAPMKRLREKATQADRLVDATHGRKTRSIIITDSNHVILSAVHADTLSPAHERQP